MDEEKPVPQNKEDTRIPWHSAAVAALQLELEQYKDALQFLPEYQLSTEPLRVDIVIIKKSRDITIEKNIAAMFRTDNVVEYKSPEHSVLVEDFYKVYGYACLYACLAKVPITEVTISFVQNRYPRDLVAHLKEVRGYQVEERRPGIYTVTGDIFPIQIINSRELSVDENLWLKDLTNTLGIPEIQHLMGASQQRKDNDLVPVYMNAVYAANAKKIKEAYKMSVPATFEEFVQYVGEDLGLNIKVEERKAREIAKNFHAKGYPVEDIADATGFSPETIRELAQK
jgi:hypothetical protein